MKRILFAFLVAHLIFSGTATAGPKPFIDPDKELIDEEIKAVTIDCIKKEKKPLKKLKCGEDLQTKYKEEGKIRGTDEYCEKNYGGMSFDELEKLLFKVKSQKDNARMSGGTEGPFPGELVFDDFMVEEIWIKLRLGELQKAQRKELEKKLFGKTQKP
jgi:hypothetical protein